MEVKRNSVRKRWSIREITTLHKRRVAGERTADLANEVGVTHFALRKAFNDYGFRLPTPTPDAATLARIADEFMSGGNLSEMADELHLGYHQLYSMLTHRRLVTRRRKHWTADEVSCIRTLFDDGVSAVDIAERYGITRFMVYHLLKRTATPKRNYTAWAPVMIERAVFLMEEKGWSLDDVAEDYNTTAASLRMALTRRGRLPRREGWTQEKLLQVRSRLSKGESLIAIARSFGVTSTTLKNKLNKMERT